MQELEKQLLSTVRIFVDNDALAFFDVNNPPNKPTDVAKIIHNPTEVFRNQQYNFLVEEINYFSIGEYKDSLCTVSVTGPCIVFCAYTNENGRIKSSGVYHAESMPPQQTFQERLYKLIDTVRSNPNEQVTVKATGSDAIEKELQKLRDDIINLLAAKDVKIKPEHILLGGKDCRVTEFHPLSGQLITCFEYRELYKTII